ncbi:hypothetical protein [Gynuella sp.]
MPKSFDLIILNLNLSGLDGEAQFAWRALGRNKGEPGVRSRVGSGNNLQ